MQKGVNQIKMTQQQLTVGDYHKLEKYVKELEGIVATMEYRNSTLEAQAGQVRQATVNNKNEKPAWIQNRDDLFNGSPDEVESENTKALKSAAANDKSPSWYSNFQETIGEA